jgi:hypothetical protein
MFKAITKGAYHLDLWLQTHLGRPYNALLGIGLIAEIIRAATELASAIKTPQQLADPIIHIVVASALLIHQLGELSEHLENRGDGGRVRRRK